MLFVTLTLFGLLIALRPLGVTAVLLLLAGTRGTIRSLGFAIGWVITIAVIGVAVFVVFQGAQRTASQRAVSHAAVVIEFVVGVCALIAAVVMLRRSRSRLTERRPPQWLGRLDKVGVTLAFLAGVVTVSHLTVAVGSVEIYRAHLPETDVALALGWLVIVGTSSIVVPVVLVAVAPERYRPRLAQLTESINAHSHEMAIVIVAVLGAYLMFRGISAQR
jgi:Sap, sulfolipid-1-addressing protein